MKCGKCGYRTTHLIPTMCDGGQPTRGRTSIRDAELLAVDVDPCEKCDHMLCILARWILRYYDGTCAAPDVKSEARPAIPLDAAPCDDGSLVLVGGVAQVVDMFSAPGERWKSHFATCPDADQHRRGA